MDGSGRRHARRDAGRAAGITGCFLAAVGIATAFHVGGVSIVSGVIGASLGVAGYFLGSRGWGGAGLVFSIAALFIGLSVGQNLF